MRSSNKPDSGLQLWGKPGEIDTDEPGGASRADDEFVLGDLIRSISNALAIVCRYDLPQIEFGVDFYQEVRRFEALLIRRALLCSGGSQTKAARLLGMKLTTLNSKIKLLEIGTDSPW